MISSLAVALFAACGRTAESPVAPVGVTSNAVLPAAGPNSTTKLVISEIMADPATISDANGEWFELHNPGTFAGKPDRFPDRVAQRCGRRRSPAPSAFLPAVTS